VNPPSGARRRQFVGAAGSVIGEAVGNTSTISEIALLPGAGRSGMPVADELGVLTAQASMTNERSIQDASPRALASRIIGEYLEMPGLSLTIEQACRLWGCDIATCRHVVDLLVSERVLRWSRDDHLVLVR
jgi:hypothetical protein